MEKKPYRKQEAPYCVRIGKEEIKALKKIKATLGITPTGLVKSAVEAFINAFEPRCDQKETLKNEKNKK